jgi:hypothetical protein
LGLKSEGRWYLGFGDFFGVRIKDNKPLEVGVDISVKGGVEFASWSV